MRNERMLAEFIELVQTDSASRKETLVANKLIQKLSDLGFEIRRDNVGQTFGGECDNVLGILKGELPGTLLLCSHMDRVPNGYGIKPVEKDGILYSDGTTILAADDIAGVCVILEAVRRVLDAGAKLPTLEVLFTVGEELSLCGSAGMDPNFIQAKEGYIFDSSGSFGRFVSHTPGRCSLSVEITGLAAHAGNEPEKGIDAAKCVAEILAKLPTGRLDPETTSNFPVIETGTKATNVVCDYAKLVGEARSFNDARLLSYQEEFKTLCEETAAKYGAGCKVGITVDYHPMNVEKDSHVVQVAQRAGDKLGANPHFDRAGGGMDANNFNYIGIATIGVACGYSKNHTLQEQMVLEDFFKAGDLAEQLILTWAEDCK